MIGHICKLQAHKSRDVSKTYLKQSILWANVTVKKVTNVVIKSLKSHFLCVGVVGAVVVAQEATLRTKIFFAE